MSAENVVAQMNLIEKRYAEETDDEVVEIIES